MVGMTVEQIGIYGVADLERERERDDRLRWELLDGELVMTPSPRYVHQDMVGRLYIAMMAAVRGSLAVAMAPIDVHVSDSVVLQPDLVVAGHDQVGDSGVVGVPVLAAEVLSPSTRRHDLVTKLRILEREAARTAGSWTPTRSRSGRGSWSTASTSCTPARPVTRRSGSPSRPSSPSAWPICCRGAASVDAQRPRRPHGPGRPGRTPPGRPRRRTAPACASSLRSTATPVRRGPPAARPAR